jgi:DNA mismatch repair protein MutS2
MCTQNETRRCLQIAVFESILADLGDTQSLEQSLSTFSGHVTRARDLLSAAGPRTLVLLDELGSGTDPADGAALAIALLRTFSQQVRTAGQVSDV